MTFIQNSERIEHRLAGDTSNGANELLSRPAAYTGDEYRDLLVRDEPDGQTFWCSMRQSGTPSYTHDIMEEFKLVERRLGERCAGAFGGPVPEWFVMASAVPGIFSFGGDLRHFFDRIQAGDHAALRGYGHAAVRAVHRNSVAFDLPLVTIALVQGDALGGGFEHALSFDVIVAERGTKFGLPEVLFNMFPGMGAYSFLSRRLDRKQTEELIMSGAVHTAEEMHAMGVVDVLAEPGQGEQAVRSYVSRIGRKHNAMLGMMRARRRVNPVPLQELLDVVDIWADTAMRLTAADLRRMSRLIVAQDRRMAVVRG